MHARSYITNVCNSLGVRTVYVPLCAPRPAPFIDALHQLEGINQFITKNECDLLLGGGVDRSKLWSQLEDPLDKIYKSRPPSHVSCFSAGALKVMGARNILEALDIFV